MPPVIRASVWNAVFCRWVALLKQELQIFLENAYLRLWGCWFSFWPVLPLKKVLARTSQPWGKKIHGIFYYKVFWQLDTAFVKHAPSSQSSKMSDGTDMIASDQLSTLCPQASWDLPCNCALEFSRAAGAKSLSPPLVLLTLTKEEVGVEKSGWNAKEWEKGQDIKKNLKKKESSWEWGRRARVQAQRIKESRSKMGQVEASKTLSPFSATYSTSNSRWLSSLYMLKLPSNNKRKPTTEDLPSHCWSSSLGPNMWSSVRFPFLMSLFSWRCKKGIK